MQIHRAVGALAACGLLAGCATTEQVHHDTFQPPSGDYRLLVIEPDITAGVLTAGGRFELRRDWTEQARRHVLDALVAHQSRRGAETKIAITSEETGADPALVTDLVWLHNAVGEAIRFHKFSPMPLPTKESRFDWTLGRHAVQLGAQSQYDYALFLHAQDSFSSGGRAALEVAGLLACGLGNCVFTDGGTQSAFASLVDLKTGQVVWFNTLFSEVGDIRTAEGADQLVSELLAGLDSAGSADAVDF